MKLKILLVPFVVILLATACADTTTTALKVGDESFSRGELLELFADVGAEIAAEQRLAERFDVGGGVLPTTLSAALLSQVIVNSTIQQLLEADGIDVGDAEVDRLLRDGAGTGSETIDLVLARTNARTFAAEAAGLDWFANAKEVPVELDPRFGRWVAETLLVLGPGGGPSSS